MCAISATHTIAGDVLGRRPARKYKSTSAQTRKETHVRPASAPSAPSARSRAVGADESQSEEKA